MLKSSFGEKEVTIRSAQAQEFYGVEEYGPLGIGLPLARAYQYKAPQGKIALAVAASALEQNDVSQTG